jgi:uncharacterized protein YbaR (Trm112 family)
MIKVSAEKANFAQLEYYCPYCKGINLLYLWNDKRMVGLGLDKWLFCPSCKRKFKIGLYGIQELELEVEVENDS